jgi:hypothetical protein
MTPEGRVKKVVKGVLDQHRAWHFWPVQTGYGEFVLDCIGCHQGAFFAIETKAPGAKPTPRQKAIAERMNMAGAAVFILDGTNMETLTQWLSRPRP